MTEGLSLPGYTASLGGVFRLEMSMFVLYFAARINDVCGTFATASLASLRLLG